MVNLWHPCRLKRLYKSTISLSIRKNTMTFSLKNSIWTSRQTLIRYFKTTPLVVPGKSFGNSTSSTSTFTSPSASSLPSYPKNSPWISQLLRLPSLEAVSNLRWKATNLSALKSNRALKKKKSPRRRSVLQNLPSATSMNILITTRAHEWNLKSTTSLQWTTWICRSRCLSSRSRNSAQRQKRV